MILVYSLPLVFEIQVPPIGFIWQVKSFKKLYVVIAEDYNITSSLLPEQIHDNTEFDPIHPSVEFLQLILNDLPDPL